MAMTDSKLSSDLFTPWSASPYYHLNPFMHSIMPTNLLVLGHIEKSKPGKPKTTPAKQKNKKPKLLRECLVLTQKIFWFSLGLLFFVLKWKKQKLCSVWFFEWIWSIKISKKNSCVFCVFVFIVMVWYGFKSQKTKKTAVVFVFLRYWLIACMQKKAKKNTFFCFCFYCYGLIRFQKQKTLEFFGFLRYWLVACMQKKKLIVFFLLLKPNKTRENQKNIYFESKPNILSKVCFFCFFWFCCSFGKIAKSTYDAAVCLCMCILMFSLPVVPHKAVAEVSEIGHL